ncbi:hypothetical protein DL546_003197 [Coniochaeta pulveracea]|uniref:Uncharacterized protein n=1 Tax=Coniochaeta pulveracea TaxID=177199 RepID=A0A420Y5J6_9PEZI|nr:hypothetical protein DL546_003197 [Coniochaeta pulveracea]
MKVEYDAMAAGALLASGNLFHTIVRREVTSSFAVYSKGSLDSVATDLGDSCISALYTNISCPEYPVSDWRSAKWRGTPDDDTVLSSVCTSGCQASLKSWFNTVSSACAGKMLHEATPMRIGGFMWEGWNETCAMDPKTKKYCNGK